MLPGTDNKKSALLHKQQQIPAVTVIICCLLHNTGQGFQRSCVCKILGTVKKKKKKKNLSQKYNSPPCTG